MKYLVTGGAGFIGSNLVDFLLEKDNEIIIVDDLSSGFKENIAHILNDKRIKFINKKVQNLGIDEIKDINGIFHLGAQASVPYSIEEFYDSSKNNLDSSIKVLDFARKLKIPIVYATSSAVYGNLAVGDDIKNEFDILSPYALDKLVLEQYAKMCFDVYKIPSIGLRFFNVYGPRQDPSNPYSGVISIFIDRLLKKENIIINGGYQTRDFVYVGDIVNVLYSSMKKIEKDKIYEVLNVGTGRSVTIDRLAEILIDLIGFKPEIKYQPLPFGDPERSGGTYEKLQKVLNLDLNNFVKLEDGLGDTINFFKGKK